MRHYEIIFMVRPEQTEAQVETMVQTYQNLITSKDGKVHRVENWGKRQLAYLINNKISRAYYVCLNVECERPVLLELEEGLKFNDVVLRFICVRMDEAPSGPSVMLQSINKEEPKSTAAA